MESWLSSTVRRSDPGAETAQALWFPRARSVELRDEVLPPVGPEDVRVRAVVSGLSAGTELLVYRGFVPPDMTLDLPTLRGSFGFPVKYGYASVGRVLERGAAVRGLQQGDLVFVHQPHQTEYVVAGGLPIRLPDTINPGLGVFLANLETAVNVVLDAHPHFGERVAIFGQGVVGLLLTQLLRRAGASLIVAVDPVSRRRNLAEQVGADVAISPEGAGTFIKELTGGVGVDLALEVSGNPAALTEALECTAFQGTVVVTSWYGSKPVSAPLGGRFHRERLRIMSSQVGSVDPALAPRWDRARRADLARDLLTRLQLAPLISHRIPFKRASQAYALLDHQSEEVAQVVLTYGPDDV